MGTGGTAEKSQESGSRKKSETSGEYPYLILHETRNIAERDDYASALRMALAGQPGRLSSRTAAPSQNI
jgi:hypothetical protein